MSDKRNWSSHIEFIALLTTIIGGVYMIDSRVDNQGQRIDKLYEIFVANQEELKLLHGRACVIETKMETKKQ